MALQLTLSCDSDKVETGPTLIHSTGVQDYKIPPEIVSNIKDSTIKMVNLKRRT